MLNHPSVFFISYQPQGFYAIPIGYLQGFVNL
ncbi:hypothetical protein PANA5342_1086 [Pantoea ananatis LMG 5342]|nr:hypothetical protein PANA5342_1086 [Pantoea ananatis LMG 5342]